MGRPLPGSAPPTMLNPQEAFSFRCKITVLGYWRLLGIFCQYIQEGTKLEAPKDVSGPSMTPNTTWSRLMVAFSVATAWECVSPQRLVPSTDNRMSPFWNDDAKVWKSICQISKPILFWGEGGTEELSWRSSTSVPFIRRQQCKKVELWSFFHHFCKGKMQRKENVDLKEIIIFSRTRKHQKFFVGLIKK